MIRPDFREVKYQNELYHYGMPRRSGRYPYGSGDKPYQSLRKKVVENVKEKYNKIPKPVKTVTKIGIKIGTTILISQALGVVGGKIVNSIAGPALPDAINFVKDFVPNSQALEIASKYVKDNPQTVEAISKYAKDSPKFVKNVLEYAKDNPQTIKTALEYAKDNPQIIEKAFEYANDNPQIIEKIIKN